MFILNFFKRDGDRKPGRRGMPFLVMKPADFFKVVTFLTFVHYMVYRVSNRLPTPLTIDQESRHPGEFIAERAMFHVRNLTGLGPRPVGSFENEVHAPNYLTKDVHNIIKNAKKQHRISIDVQKVSGAFTLDFLDGMTNVYRNVQNVIVKFGSSAASQSILINCHYDSVADSPGGNDDSANCAIMLEILRILSTSHVTLRKNIIFLFNGAEENFMEGSHGFITTHKWAKEVVAVINLDSCGAGGKEILFQVGPENPWLVDAYAESVVYPVASTIAQEIFQSGIFPGDTDFRIFRDFGNLSGLDLAAATNGYIYHTKLDDANHVDLGSLQNTGSNVLALAMHMANSTCPDGCETEGNVIFFDLFGMTVITLSESTGRVLNIIGIILTILLTIKNATFASEGGFPKWKFYYYVLLCMFSVVLGVLLSILVCTLCHLFLTMTQRAMPWYTRPWWLYFLYFIPTLSTTLSWLFEMKVIQAKLEVRTSHWSLFQTSLCSHQMVLSLFVLVGLIFKIRSVFFFTIDVFSLSLINLGKEDFVRRYRNRHWIVAYVAIVLIPLIMKSFVIHFTFQMLIPIAGRSGGGTPIELIFASLASALCSFYFLSLFPLFTIIMEIKDVTRSLIYICVGAFLVLLLTPLGFPYSSSYETPSPQRYVVMHTNRVYHNAYGEVTSNTSGFWIVDLDPNSPRTVRHFVPEVASAERVTDCDKQLFCGLPYLLPVSSLLWQTHWIPGPRPNIFVDTYLKLNSKNQISEDTVRLDITASGPDHITIFLAPELNTELVSWSLTKTKPLRGPAWNGRLTYFIFYSCASGLEPLNFTVDIKVGKGFDVQSKIVDLAISGHFLHGANQRSVKLKKFLAQFPPWTVTSGWTAIYLSYIF